VRYYVQPVEVPIHNPGKEEWNHVPDTLVFHRNTIPFLYQFKHELEEDKDERVEQINFFCERYVLNQDWNYLVIYPKMMPPVLSRNIRFLKNFLKERSYYRLKTLMYLATLRIRPWSRALWIGKLIP
jgi:hypothetical protein